MNPGVSPNDLGCGRPSRRRVSVELVVPKNGLTVYVIGISATPCGYAISALLTVAGELSMVMVAASSTVETDGERSHDDPDTHSDRWSIVRRGRLSGIRALDPGQRRDRVERARVVPNRDTGQNPYDDLAPVAAHQATLYDPGIPLPLNRPILEGKGTPQERRPVQAAS